MIEAVRTFSNCPFGIECFISQEGLLDTLVLFLDCADLKIRQVILNILTAIIYVNQPMRILAAFSALQATLQEACRFDLLLRLIEKQGRLARRMDDPRRDESIKFVSDCLIFFNLLLEDLGDFNMRVMVRNQIMRAPFTAEFERLDEIGLAHQKQLLMAGIEADQEMFAELLHGSNLLEVVPKEGCAPALFSQLHQSVAQSSDKDTELSKLFIDLLMVPPDNQLRSNHVRLLRKVLEAVLFSGTGLSPDFSSAPVPLMALSEFASCLADIDHRIRAKDVSEQLRKQVAELQREKTTLEANLDEQISQIRDESENSLVRLRLELGDLRRDRDALQKQLDEAETRARDADRKAREVEDRLSARLLERVQSPMDVPVAAIGDAPPPALKGALAAPTAPAPPAAPPLPAALKGALGAPAVLAGVPMAPALPAFLRRNGAVEPPVAPPLPPFMRAPVLAAAQPPAAGIPAPPAARPPPPPPMPGGMGVSPLFPGAAEALPTSPFPLLPRPSHKVKPLPLAKLSWHQIQGTFWQAIDTASISSGIFDLRHLDRLLEVVGKAEERERPVAATVELFDSKDSKNLSIVLKSVKMSDEDLIRAIMACDAAAIPEKLVASLHDLAPKATAEKIALLTEQLRAGTGPRLDRPERLFIQLFTVDGWRSALSLMRIQAKAKEFAEQIHDQMRPIRKACGLLRDAQQLFSTLGCLLFVGNYTNQGTFRGDAFGFQVSSIKAATDVRTSQKEYTLLDYLVEALADRQPEWLQFAEHVEVIELARKISLAEIDAAYAHLSQAREEAQKLLNPGLVEAMSTCITAYVAVLDGTIATAKEEMESTMADLRATFAYYGEPHTRTSHDSLFAALIDLFHDVATARIALAERQREAETKAKRLEAAEKGRDKRARSLATAEHKFGFVDNIMDKLRSEIAAAAGKPQHRT